MGPPEQYAHGDVVSQTGPPTTTVTSSNLPLLFPQFPQAPINFFDHNTILQDLLGLAERCSSVTLLGAGGVGKTAIALALLEHDQIRSKFGEQRYLLSCDGVGNSLDSFIDCLSSTIGFPSIDMTQLRSNLGTSPRVLVLDGVDSVLDPLASGAAEITAAIEEIGRCPNVFLIVTSRMVVKIPGFRQVDVPTVSLEGARNIFHGYCDLGRSTTIDELLSELDFHPLSIVLLASAARENGWDDRAMMEMWRTGETSILEASGCQSLEANIQSLLCTPTIEGLGKTAGKILKKIAASPDGVEEIQLLNIFPKIRDIRAAVNVLCKFHLMYRQEGLLKMLSPLRLYFRESSAWVLLPRTSIGTDSGPSGSLQLHVPITAKILETLRFAKRKLLAFFHLSGRVNRPNNGFEVEGIALEPLPRSPYDV